MRKVFLDDLPITKGFGANKDKDIIDWKKSIGLVVGFCYDDINGEIEIIDYTPKGQYLTIKYQDKEFKIKSDGFRMCKIGKFLNKYTSDFKIEIGKHFKDNKRDLIIIDREYRERDHTADKKGRVYVEKQKWYKFLCNNCGWGCGFIEESSLIKNGGCSCCYGRTVVDGINDIATTNPELLEFLANKEDGKKYNKYSEKKVLCKCRYCGSLKYVVMSDLYSNKSMGCYCGDNFSRGHKYIHKLLSQLSIEFVDNYKPSWCKYYNEYKNKEMCGEYDFFIESMKLIIEVDGGFHRKDNKMNGQSKEESQYIDDMKDKLAEENGYRVIRVDYELGDFKEDILNSELANIFDLSKIDWDKCEEFSLSNLVKKVCERWLNKEEWETTKSLAKEFGLSNTTIHSYIKRGVKIGWCEYSAEEENMKNNLKNAERNKARCNREVEIFKDGQSKGVFESITSLCKASQKLFGVRLDIGNVSNLCRRKGIQSKGFTFKYVD